LLSPPPPHIAPLQPPSADYVDDAGLSERAMSESQATTVEHADTEQAPAASKGSRSSTSESPVEQSARDLMDISSSSEEEGEIINNLQQEKTDATTTYKTEQRNTDEQLTNGSIDSIITQDGYSRSQPLLNLSRQDRNPSDVSQLVPSVDHTVKSPSPKAQTQGSGQILNMIGDVPKDPVDSSRQLIGAGSLSDNPLEPEVFEDSSDHTDSEIYEPPEPIATASTELRQPTTLPLSPVLFNATSHVENEQDLTPNVTQGTLSTGAAFQAVELPSSVEPVQVRTRLLPTLARFAHLLVGCKLSNTTEERTLSPLREPVEAIQGISLSSEIYLRCCGWISFHDVQS